MFILHFSLVHVMYTVTKCAHMPFTYAESHNFILVFRYTLPVLKICSSYYVDTYLYCRFSVLAV